VLSAEKARSISIDTREGLGPTGVTQLFKDQLKQSDAMWKRINEGFKLGDRAFNSK
jgi:hypothetical protein